MRRSFTADNGIRKERAPRAEDPVFGPTRDIRGHPVLATILAMIASFPHVAGAEDEALASGAALAQRVYARPDGSDSASRGQMILTEHGRSPRHRTLFTFRREPSAREISTLIRFESPTDIRGVGMLTVDMPHEQSRQWLYLPELRRTRRISASHKGGRFVGSDFFYEDLRDREPELDTHRLIGKGVYAGTTCDLLESTPVDPDNSVYARRLSWIDPQSLLALRVDFFAADSTEPIKRYTVNTKAVIDGYWTVTEATMRDLVSAHETRLTVERVVYDRGIPPRLFSRATLEDPSRDMRHRP